MPNYGFNALQIQIDSADGGSLADISAQVLSINGVKVNRMTEEVTPAGASFFAALQTGLRKMDDVQLDLLYDDTAVSSSKAIFVTSAHAATRTLKVTYGSTNYTQVECWIKDYQVVPENGKLTKLKVTLEVTGTITEN